MTARAPARSARRTNSRATKPAATADEPLAREALQVRLMGPADLVEDAARALSTALGAATTRCSCGTWRRAAKRHSSWTIMRSCPVR